MKKITILAIALLVGIVVMPQNNNKRQMKSALSATVGPTFPMGDFESTNLSNDNAGFAKTGVNVNVNYDYVFVQNVGVAANLIIGFHNIHDEILHAIASNSDADHYQYTGLLIGPMLRVQVLPKTDLNLKVMGGVTRSNSPEFNIQGATVISGDWATAFGWKIDGDLRYNFTKRGFAILSLGYLQTRPDFKVEGFGETSHAEIHVSAVYISGGLGIRF